MMIDEWHVQLHSKTKKTKEHEVARARKIAEETVIKFAVSFANEVLQSWHLDKKFTIKVEQ